MKWKNIDIGAAYYYITATFTICPAKEADQDTEIMATHANGRSRYAVWKEHVRSLASDLQ